LFYMWEILKLGCFEAGTLMSWESWIWDVLRRGRFVLVAIPLNLPTWFTEKRVTRIFSPMARFAELVNLWRMRRLGATPSPPPSHPKGRRLKGDIKTWSFLNAGKYRLLKSGGGGGDRNIIS
jgi:hypothetical protein